MMLTSSISTISSSAINFAFTEIHPIEKRAVVEKLGIDQKRIDINQAFKSFSDYCYFQNETIIYGIKIPDRFDSTKLIELFSRQWSTLDDDENELVKKLSSKNNNADFLYDVTVNLRETTQKYAKDLINEYAKDSINSDFPFSFFLNFVTFNKLKMAFLEHAEKVIRRYRNYYRTNEPHSKKAHFQEMKRSLSPCLELFSDVLLDQERLLTYVNLWNSETYDDLSKDKFITMTKLDEKELMKLQNKFEAGILEFNKILFDVRMPYTPPESLMPLIDFGNPISIAFSNLLSIKG